MAQRFKRGKIDTTLFTKGKKVDLLIVQIYVNDIVFGSKNTTLCEEFISLMTNKFDMSMMRNLNFFLRLQVK